MADASEKRQRVVRQPAGPETARESAARVQGTAPSPVASRPEPGTKPGHRLATRASNPAPTAPRSFPAPPGRLEPPAGHNDLGPASSAQAPTLRAAFHTRHPWTYYRRVATLPVGSTVRGSGDPGADQTTGRPLRAPPPRPSPPPALHQRPGAAPPPRAASGGREDDGAPCSPGGHTAHPLLRYCAPRFL